MADESLRLGVDPRPAEEGFRRYDQAADRSIQKTEQLAQSIDAYERGLRGRLGASDIAAASAEYDKLHQSIDDAHAEAIRMNEAMANTAESTGRSVQGLGRLNTTLASMARQAAGVHPVMGQLASVVSTFALGTAVTTGVLAGMAAVAFAIRKIGEESRLTKERNQDLFESLRSLGEANLGPQGPVAERALVAGLETQLRELMVRQLTARTAGSTYTPLLDREIWDVANQLGIARGGLRVLEEQFGAQSFEGPEYDGLYHRDRRRREREEAERIARNNAAFRLEDRLRDDQNALSQRGWFEGRGMGTAQPLGLDALADRFGDRLEQRKRELDAWFQYQEDKEEQLKDRRIAANQALIVSLAQVGRAYGGVVDQVLNLAAATGSIALAGRLPGFGKGESATLTDMAVGYGSAALSGVGFGVSTGNPVLGGVGGAASGFAMAGPYGAIVGGVAGIVSGLFEQGERAKQAQRQWEITLQSFEDMWDTLTPVQQTDRAFQRTFGMTIEEARAYAELFQGVEGAEKIFEAIDAYDRQIAQAKEATEAQNDLADAYRDVTSALNSPSGLNLSLYRWMAAQESPDDRVFGGWPGVGARSQVTFNVTVNGATNPRETAAMVIEDIRRQARLAGPNPLLLELR